MAVEISRSNSTKVWDQAGIELATPGFAVRHVSVVRQVTKCFVGTCAVNYNDCLPCKNDWKNNNILSVSSHLIHV